MRQAAFRSEHVAWRAGPRRFPCEFGLALDSAGGQSKNDPTTMDTRLIAALALMCALTNCENKFREQHAPANLSLPQPDRGPCGKQPPPVLYVRLPQRMREELRDKRYCKPLGRVLKKRKLGHAESVAPPPRNDPGFSGCAVFTADPDAALGAMRDELKQLRVPKRTVVEELCNGVGSVHTVW